VTAECTSTREGIVAIQALHKQLHPLSAIAQQLQVAEDVVRFVIQRGRLPFRQLQRISVDILEAKSDGRH